MTKSTITRERLREIAEDGFLKHGESKELARMALAAMDGEPVILYRERNPYNCLTTGWQELTENEFSFLKENAGENAEFLTLYRHAQPAPVIPDGYVMVPKEPTESMVIAGFESEPDEFFSESEVWEAYQKMSGCEQAAFRARLCWTAMLAAAPQEVKGE